MPVTNPERKSSDAALVEPPSSGRETLAPGVIGMSSVPRRAF